VRRLIDFFEERMIALMGEIITAPEQDEIDYILAPAPFPFQDDKGQMGMGMGISVSFACPTLALGDHVLVTGVVQDPYAADSILASNLGELIASLRKMRTEANSVSNGGLFVPPGARRS
jgi:hypothetical protein